jgi:asparagine synthase (glutamine-hydrolysing)
MNTFGFIARGDARAASDVLSRHALRELGAGITSCTEATASAALAAWASDVAADRGVLVALRGSPVWARPFGEPSRRADAAGLLKAYLQAGNDAVSRLAGRFAVAILDGVSGRAVLALDPMGIERLAYSSTSDLLVFGSSAEAVATSPGIEAGLSRQALFNYLMLHMVPAPDTIFTGVRKLRAGHMAVWSGGRVEVTPWWRPKFVESGGESLESLKAELHTSLATAVADCAPDERTGAFLSGGLDSSTVAGVLARTRPHAVDTFSIGFGYPEFDELSYARIANQRFGCRGHEHTITGDDIADAFPLIARAYDEPFGNSSALPLYYCARLARESGMEHLLAGDGGDELFAGNSRYARQNVFARYERVPALLRKGLVEPLLAALPEALRLRPFRRASAFIGRANVPLPERLEIWNLLYRVGARDVLHPEFLASIDPATPLAGMQEVWDEAPGDSQLNHLLYFDWQYTLADNDLRKVETMAALAGIRVSYPMLHPDVIDLSLRVPPELKMPGTALRHFYKEATRGFLPDEIINKKKHGFGLPFGLWLHDSPRLRDQVMGNLSDLRRRNIVQPAFLDQLLHLHGSDDASYHGVFVWVLAMLEQWLAEHRHDAS